MTSASRSIDRVEPYLYVAPALTLLGLFVYWPIVLSLVLSVQRWDFLSSHRPFVGFENYRILLGSNEFWNSLSVTSLFVAGSVPVRMALALAIAIQLGGDGRLRRLLRAVYFLPVVSSAVAVAITWVWLLQTDQGLVNQLLGLVGIPAIPWLRSPSVAIWSIAMVNVWKHIGYDIVVYLAGLKAIPLAYYESAALDGANRWDVFRRITWPLLLPTTLFLLVVAVIDSFQVFTLVNIMTGGGPALGTDVLVHLLYRTGFITFEIGKASALAILLFLLLMLLTLGKFAIAKGRVRYDLA